MKTQLLLFAMGLGSTMLAQTYTPVAVTGYNRDAIAESSPASSSTSGAIDGSDYVLYSVAYGTVFSTNKGIPNSGVISNSTRSYQMEPFGSNNTCFITGGSKDSLSLTTPASYAALSLLGLATEGAGNMTATVRFTDGTNQVFTGLVMPDWFNNPNAILSGIDRTGRTSNSPDYQSSNPRLYAVDLILSCANRSKTVSKIVIQNTGINPRICVFAVSAAVLPSYTVNASDACFGMTNGKASVSATGGLPAFTYTWTTSPVQNTATATNLPPGTYTVTINDAAGCTGTVATSIGQPTAALTSSIGATKQALCIGESSTLTANGAGTYTWSTGAGSPSIAVSPTTSTTYSVSGTSANGCPVTGSISITVNALPVLSFSLAQNVLCTNSSSIALNATPAGGTYTGAGITGAGYSPAAAGPGTYTLSYSYTDIHGCSATAAVSTTVNAAPVVSFSLPQTQFCPNSDVILLTGTPSGGNYSGPGVTGTVFTPSSAGVGTHTLSYVYTNAAACSATATAVATVNTCTGIAELGPLLLNLFPNPNQGSFHLTTDESMSITIHNELGQLIRTISTKAGEDVLIGQLPAGIYIVTGQTHEKTLRQKVVVN